VADLKSQANERLAECREEKATISAEIEEAYFFSAPRRVRASTSRSHSKSKPKDDAELMTSFAGEVADDFAEMLMSSFTPPEADWAERKIMGLDDARAAQFNEQAKKDDKKIFGMIRASNYYAEKGKLAVPDAAIGVVSLMIDSMGNDRPVNCRGIPIRELEFNLGPDGRIDDRWECRQTRYRYLPALLPDVDFAKFPKLAKKIRDEGKKSVMVQWGFWRLWDRRDDEVWQHVVLVGDELVFDGELVGQGACPMVVGRFGATPDFAWPDGPMLKVLPELRQLDYSREAIVENIDFRNRPPRAYEDDGVINLEGGVEPGMFYPKRAAQGRTIFENIFDPGEIDVAMLDEANLKDRIRRMHYVDYPEQKGKTPPSASQWLDEMVLKQRRIGTPGHSFWREEPFETFQRFRFIAEQRGTIQKIKVPGGASLQPYNPAQRAFENQEVLTGTRFAQIGASIFPQTWQVAVDELQTLANFKQKLGDEIVVLRSKEDIAEKTEQLASLAGVFGPRLPGGAQGQGDGSQ